MFDLTLLKKICDTPGVAGFEDPVRTVIENVIRPYVDKITIDTMGNLIAYRKAFSRRYKKRLLRIMLAAHMDEVGFIVKSIDKDGFLRIEPVGGIDLRAIVGQKVIVYGEKGAKLWGVIPPRPLWLVSEEEKRRVVDVKELYIDPAMPRERVATIVNIGDPVVVFQEFTLLNEEVVSGRNFDNRIGVYVMVEVLRNIKELQMVDLYAVATVQEELGVRGASVAAFQIQPDYGIAIDGSLAADIPDVKEEDRGCVLGKGVGIYLFDRLTVSDRQVVKWLIEVAETNQIPYQLNIGGGTDASAIQRTGAGAKVCTIGAPVRYMHSGVQLCHISDIVAAVNLLLKFLERLDQLAKEGAL